MKSSKKNSVIWFHEAPNVWSSKFKHFGFIVVWMILISCFHLGSSGRVKTPLSWQAQTGVVTFTITSPDSYTDSRYASKYDITLQILQLEGQQYRIILGFGRIDQRFSPTTTPLPLTQITSLPTGDSSVSTTFTIELFVEEQTLLTTVKANYLLIGAYLKSNSLMMGSSVNINLGASVCDGLITLTTCTYVKGINYFTTNMDMTKYKVFLSISGFSLYSDSTTTVSPFTSTGIQSKLQIEYTSFVSTTSNIITVQVTVERVSLSLLSFHIIAAHLDMFNSILQKNTVLIEYSKIITAVGTYQGTFSEKVLKNNYFMGLMALKGRTFAFQVYQSTPFNQKINVRLYGASSYLKIHGFVIYGFTDECSTRRSCRACYVAPMYECTQCQKNFLPTTPPNSICRCPRPYTEVSGICDIVPYGCIVASRLADQSIQCYQCNIAKRLTINNSINQCQCIPKFQMDTNNVCQDICGDGYAVNSKCDDGNTLAGDGCSPTCTLQRGFICDTSVQPTQCHSLAPLIYEIQEIIKIQDSNSAMIKLRLKNEFNYPFAVYKQQFQPLQQFIKFKIILSQSPYNQLTITDFQLINIDQDKLISLTFNFNVTVENTDAKIQLNYQQTYYLDYIQVLDFTLKGDNEPLKFEAKIQTFHQIGSGMLFGALVSIVLLVFGLVTPKFIGLQTIVNLQLIFFSQILIFDYTKFPVGFMFLSNLQYTAGFNRIFEFSQYILMTDVTRKMFYIKQQKMIIENFNINFVMLFVCFVALIITFLIRRTNEKNVLERKDMIRDQQKDQKDKGKVVPNKQNQTFRKVNEIVFFISNQIAFWLFLPLLAAITAGICIENYTLVIKTDHDLLINKADEVIAILSCFMIYGIILSNFGNMWLGNFSIQTLNQRPQELKYKRQFFVYLTIIGMYIFFMNDMDSDGIYCSAVVLIIHIIHVVYIYVTDPYKQSLKIHTIGMMFNNIVYFLFLLIINIINYTQDIDSDVTIGLGYGMIGCCSISIIITIIRLYYELRYGKQLELKLQAERLIKQQQEKLRKELQKKRLKNQMENDAMNKLSQKQKIRQKNFYLYQNQLNQDSKKEFMQWLEGRQFLDTAIRDTQYFKHFAEKPLTWLEKNDREKYILKVNEINQNLEKDRTKNAQKQENKDLQTIVSKLRKQVDTMKQKKTQQLEKHQKNMKNNTNYAMNIMKNQKEKLFQKQYSLKKKRFKK